MKTIVGLFAAAALVGLTASAVAQHGRGRAPPGSYRESCRDIRMEGSVLHALCRRRGRGEQRTALNIARCVGDISNNDGNLVCRGGQPARPVSPSRSAGRPSGPANPAWSGQGNPAWSGPSNPAWGPGWPPR